MIQRIQSIYLLLAAIFLGIFLFVPSFSFSLPDTDISTFKPLDHWHLALIASLGALLSLLNIFLYTNRKLQIKIGWLIFVIIIGLTGILGYEYFNIHQQNLPGITYRFGAAFPLFSLILIGFSISAIKKDEKLVRSADRLR